MTLLVIDDEPHLRLSLCDYLKDCGYDTREAANGREGLGILEQNLQNIEAVIVDLRMPVMDGYSFLQEVVPRAKELPLIVLSGVGLIDEAMRAMSLGAWDFISKPLHSFEGLGYTLSRCLEKARLLRENRSYQELLIQMQTIGRIGGWSINLDTRECQWTKEMYHLLGHTDVAIPDLVGISALFVPNDRALFAEAIERAEESGESFDLELCLAQFDTTPRWVRFVGKRVDFGSSRTLSGIVQDITDQKSLELLREEIGHVIRHDLKAPLTGVIAFSQFMSEDTNLTPDQLEKLHYIEQSGWRMVRQIEMSLDIMNIERGQYQYYPYTFDLLNVVKHIVLDVEETVRKKNIIIDIILQNKPAMDSSTFMVHAEKRLCTQMLSNLIVNAVEASPKGERIVISLSDNSEYIISIHNKGAVPIDIRDRFFQKYITRGKIGGNGLGTYSANMFAKVQGGNIELNTAEEGATALVVRLPRS